MPINNVETKPNRNERYKQLKGDKHEIILAIVSLACIVIF